MTNKDNNIIAKILDRFDEKLKDFSVGVYYDKDPKRFNGTTEKEIKQFLLESIKEVLGQLDLGDDYIWDESQGCEVYTMTGNISLYADLLDQIDKIKKEI